jgi:hypothetical protein
LRVRAKRRAAALETVSVVSERACVGAGLLRAGAGGLRVAWRGGRGLYMMLSVCARSRRATPVR